MTNHELEYIKYLNQKNKLFGDDVNHSMKLCIEKEKKFETNRIKENSDELYFSYRSLIRAFFSHIEGITYVMRQIALKAYERGEVKYNIGELVLLKEETFKLDGNKIKSNDKWNNFKTNFNLTFMLFPRVFNSDFKLNKSDHRYDSFQKALIARDSITHPKSDKDFIFLPETFIATRDAIIWFNENMRNLIKTLQ